MNAIEWLSTRQHNESKYNRRADTILSFSSQACCFKQTWACCMLFVFVGTRVLQPSAHEWLLADIYRQPAAIELQFSQLPPVAHSTTFLNQDHGGVPLVSAEALRFNCCARSSTPSATPKFTKKTLKAANSTAAWHRTASARARTTVAHHSSSACWHVSRSSSSNASPNVAHSSVHNATVEGAWW